MKLYAAIFLSLSIFESVNATNNDESIIKHSNIENRVQNISGEVRNLKNSGSDSDRSLQYSCDFEAHDCTNDKNCFYCMDSFDIEKYDDYVSSFGYSVVTCDEYFEAFEYGLPTNCDIFYPELFYMMTCFIKERYDPYPSCDYNSFSMCRIELDNCKNDESCSYCADNLDRSLLNSAIRKNSYETTYFYSCDDVLEIFQNCLPENCVLDGALYNVAACTMNFFS
mmetsp:Transcript_16903/g.23916  ORF Transcript_16903/g.23916 Transcript_16903/m.23916 type:complete len:224 (-) Transcript_16903:572-1243(-)